MTSTTELLCVSPDKPNNMLVLKPCPQSSDPTSSTTILPTSYHNLYPNVLILPSKHVKPTPFRHDTFTDHYSLGRSIGVGGYGEVFIALHDFQGTVHAVKHIPEHRCKHKTYCDKRGIKVPLEVALWEPLCNPGIIKLQDVFFENNTWILVMEYDEDFTDLFNHARDIYPFNLSSSTCKKIILQLIDIIQYLDQQSVDHRDIKDENILYNPSTNEIKLIDFGSASPLDSQPYTTYKGTDCYIPPEFWKTYSYSSHFATVFSIGCFYYVLLTGNTPFKDRDEVEAYSGSLEETSNFDESSFTKHEHWFVEKCLCPEPNDRMKLNHMADLIEDVQSSGYDADLQDDES